MKAAMQKTEMKKFLSMDMAERLIRVEQNVASSFNKDVPYDKTAYYLSMTPEQKKDFDKFLKNKKKKRIMMSSSVLVSFLGLSIFGIGVTGNVVSNGQNMVTFSTSQIVLAGIFGILLAYAGYSFISNKIKNKRFENTTDVINKIVVNKRVVK